MLNENQSVQETMESFRRTLAERGKTAMNPLSKPFYHSANSIALTLSFA